MIHPGSVVGSKLFNTRSDYSEPGCRDLWLNTAMDPCKYTCLWCRWHRDAWRIAVRRACEQEIIRLSKDNESWYSLWVCRNHIQRSDPDRISRLTFEMKELNNQIRVSIGPFLRQRVD